MSSVSEVSAVSAAMSGYMSALSVSRNDMVADPYAADRVGRVSGTDRVSDARVSDTTRANSPAPFEISISSPLAEAVIQARAVYDPRLPGPDSTPRGVEIDRIAMIEQGFEHLREIIATISEAAALETSTVDTTV